MVSDKCIEILKKDPPCDDRKKLMRWLMCYSRKKIEEGYSYKNAMKEAWSKVKSFCVIGNRK